MTCPCAKHFQGARDLNQYMNKTYTVVKFSNGADTVPEYLKGITDQELYNYFFNWHPTTELAFIADVLAWYQNKRGWTWKED